MKKRTAYFGVIGGVIALAAASCVFLQLGKDAPSEVAAAEQVSAAEARAIGARWRTNRTAELSLDYAQALIGAGLYDQLLTEIVERGLFADDDVSAAIFRAEASLRQGRYEEAMSVAAGSAENPYFAFARARATYALTGDADTAAKDLSDALRGPQALAGEAWLFRARIALDANDLESAAAASRRALEAGSAPDRAELIIIESAVRAGDIASAAEKLDARAKRFRGAADPEAFRLAAMIRLRAGEAKEAARLVDRARVGAAEFGRTRLLSALAKREAGDIAQAWSLVSAHLAAAPRDWAALDLAVVIARDMNRRDDAERLVTRLERERPALAIIKAMRAGAVDLDDTYDNLMKIEGNYAATGAAAMLVGAGASFRGFEDASPDELAVVELAAAMKGGDLRRIRARAISTAKNGGSPLGLALAGAAFIRLDDRESAARALIRSSAAAPDFLAPALLHAELLSNEGAHEKAANLLAAYLSRHESADRARLALAGIEAKGGDAFAAAKSFSLIAPDVVFSSEIDAERFGSAAQAAGGEMLAAMLKSARAHAPSARVLGAALAAAGDDAGAAAAYRKSVIADPGDGDLRRRYLIVMTRIGREGEAASLLGEIDLRRKDGPGGPGYPEADPDFQKIADLWVNIRQ